MEAFSARNFGLVIAYVIPGFIALVGISQPSDAARLWLHGSQGDGPSIGAVLYVVLASIGLGLTASAVRWAVIDSMHRFTGVRRPELDESNLAENLAAFDYLVEKHFRYYQFYGNSIIATLAAYAAWRLHGGVSPLPSSVAEILLAFILVVFAAGSRDALRRYYAGGIMLLGEIRKEPRHDEREARPRSLEGACTEAGSEAPRRQAHGSGSDGTESEVRQEVSDEKPVIE